eukprot:gene19252-25882_t
MNHRRSDLRPTRPGFGRVRGSQQLGSLIKAPFALLVCLASFQLAHSSAVSRELLAWDGLSNPNKFPPYYCDTRPKGSPFYLRPSYTVVEDRVVCLDVKTRQPEIESICNDMDFYKLEIEVNPKCTLGIKYVHVNGVLTTLPAFETFGPQNSRALIKCPNINLDINNASDAQICLTLSENCPSMNELCPSGVTQYSFEDEVKTTTMNGNKVYTFTFKVSDPIDTDNSCAFTDLYKAEFWTSRACQKRTVVNAYINGIKVTPMWDARTGVWRVAQLNMNNITAAGATVGLELDATSNCPTLRSLCNRMGGKCVYSLFNKKRDCCPVGENLYSLTSGYDR